MSKEKLIKFLKDHHAYSKYMKNIVNKKCRGIYRNNVENADCNYDIGSAFSWMFTKEGYDYWEKLESKYRSIK